MRISDWSSYVCSSDLNGVILYENAGATYRAVLALTVPIAGWTHLAVGYDNGRPSVFLNGKLVGTGAASASRVHAMMGFPGARPRYFEGDLAALEVHARVFSAADLAGRAAAGPPRPAAVPPLEAPADGRRILRAQRQANTGRGGEEGGKA